MKVGLYSRVSTKYKEQNPENQLIKLREYCRAKDWEYREYVDFASGAKKDRPGMKSVMTDLGSLDGILVLRLDRFGRSLQNLLDNLNTIRSQGKFFEAIDQGLRISAKKDPMNDFMLAILGAAAEFERELISERVRDGMARARKQGKIIGRGLGKKSKKMEARILELAGRGESIRMIAQKCNIPRSTVHGILSRKRNILRTEGRFFLYSADSMSWAYSWRNFTRNQRTQVQKIAGLKKYMDAIEPILGAPEPIFQFEEATA